MIEAILSKLAESGVKEIASKGSETMIKDFPKNLRNLKPEDIRDYKDADKPVSGIDISTRNKDLEGSNHPKTEVPFKAKEIELSDGTIIEGVFPEFDSTYDASLDEDQYKDTDSEQFKEVNSQLKDSVENDPELKDRFTEEQLEDIATGDTPEGYTWHHSENPGELQLVDSKIHRETGHTGGRNIWGGGTENR